MNFDLKTLELAAAASEMSTSSPWNGFVAALLTSMSTSPKRVSVAATQASIWSCSPALVGTVRIRSDTLSPSCSAMWAAAAARFSGRREAMTTLASRSASCRAIASPIPFEPPVTIAVFPVNVLFNSTSMGRYAAVSGPEWGSGGAAPTVVVHIAGERV